MRLNISHKVLRALYMYSGNQCAHYECKIPLIDESGDYVGNVCHIEAAEEGGQRYNPNQSDEERRSYDNLIILCANHHCITNNVNIYTVDVMKDMKKNHESTIANIRNVNLNEDEFIDRTASNVVNYPENLNLIKNEVENIFGDMITIDDCVTHMRNYFNHFNNVPYETRRLYAKIFLFSKFEDSSISFRSNLAINRFQTNHYKLFPHYQILEDAGLLTCEIEDDWSIEGRSFYYRAFRTFDGEDIQVSILKIIRDSIVTENDKIWFIGMVADLNFSLLDSFEKKVYL